MSEFVCPRCKTPNRNSAKFCSVCGQPFLEGVGAVPEAKPVHVGLPPETVLQNRYQIEVELGRGGFGAVYRAFDLNLNRQCAVKENLETTAEAQRQFFREASVLANLVHPNLPRVTDHFSVPGKGQYLVMDFIEGEDLSSKLPPGEAAPVEAGLNWIIQVAEALDYMHKHKPPVLHRDIKPANIRVTPEGKAVLVDFGLVKMYQTGQLKTTVGARAITPGYAPPEQYGTGITDVRTDVYAMGATAYRLLTGQEPLESVQRMAGKSILSAHQVNSQIPVQLSLAIEKAMELDPEKRYVSMSEFITALRSAVASSPFPVMQPKPEARSEVARTVVVEAEPAPMVAPMVSAPPATPSSRPASRPASEANQGGSRKMLLGVGIGVIALLCVVGVVLIGLVYVYFQNQDNTVSQADVETARAETVTAEAEILVTDTPEATQAQTATEEPTATSPVEPTSTRGSTATQVAASPTTVNVLGNPDASSSGEAYFVSEFDSPDNWHLLSVPETASSDYQAYTDGGFLYLEIQPKGITLYAFYDLVLNNPDVLIETYAQKVAGPNTNNLSLICRRSDAGWYEFSMTSGGYWYVWLYNNKKYSILTKGASTAIQMQGRPNQIQATCIGKTLTFYINGVQVGSIDDRTFLGGGQVGVSIYAEYPGLGVEFDWFRAVVP
jgi:serine/threonine protein kinase